MRPSKFTSVLFPSKLSATLYTDFLQLLSHNVALTAVEVLLSEFCDFILAKEFINNFTKIFQKNNKNDAMAS